MLLLQSKNFISFTKQIKYVRLFSQSTRNDIIYEKLKNSDAGIAIIGLNRPKANCFNVNFVGTFENVLKNIRNDKDVRVAIIKSHIPKIFCAGADLNEIVQDHKEHEIFVNSIRSLCTNIHKLPVPVIAALDGAAIGGGLELAIACDMRTTSTTTKIGFAETRLAGLPAAGGSQRFPRTVNISVAKELLYTARIINGEEAAKLGIVNYAVKQNENNNAAYLKALDLAREILPNSPIAVRMVKEVVNTGIELDIDSALKHEELCYGKLIPTKDKTEGLKAYHEKRSPKFIGE